MKLDTYDGVALDSEDYKLHDIYRVVGDSQITALILQ